jgi:hypothetical protein
LTECKGMLALIMIAIAVCEGSSLNVAFAQDFPLISEKFILSILAPFDPVVVAPTNNVSSPWFLVFGSSAPGCVLKVGQDPEAFQVVANTVDRVTTVCCDGNPSEMAKMSGRLFASMNMLSNLGFGFFHPQRPKVCCLFSCELCLKSNLSLRSRVRWL